MDNEPKEQKTLTSDQIRVSQDVRSVSDVLRNAKPYLDNALRAMADRDPSECDPIEVPPALLRDLFALAAADQKRALTLARRRSGGGDAGDGDWNPFNGIDFEFD